MVEERGARDVFAAVLRLQKEWAATATEAMRERAALIKGPGVEAVRALVAGAPAASEMALAVQGSSGVGSNARVPWIRVFSPRHSPAPTTGWYIVYLFSADGSRLYLSLNQGTTNRNFAKKPREEIKFRVDHAIRLLDAKTEEYPYEYAIHLMDRGGLGDGYERGNVAATLYYTESIPDDAELAADVDRMLSLLRVLYDEEDAAAAAAPVVGAPPRPSLEDPREFVHWVQRRYGPELVPTRRAAEDAARTLLDAVAGGMTLDQARELGQLMNSGTWAGTAQRNRFSPAFAGHALDVLVADLPRFNQWTERIWRGTSEEAATAVDLILRDAWALPGAGRSYPTMLMYLRDPTKYAVWLQLTHRGLAGLIGFDEPIGRGGGWPRYSRYCAAVSQFADELGLAPQELDAILSEAGRAMRDAVAESEPPPSLGAPEAVAARPADVSAVEVTLADVAALTHIDIEQIEEWVRLLRGRKRQALFYGPPGTGKTWVARQLALHLAGSEDRIGMVQFHPSFAYEDLIEGLRPQADASGLRYEVRPGLFREFCRVAQDTPDMTFVYVIDELNRADVGSVLGELMLLLEYRGREIRLPYSQKPFSVPENVIVLATMNTADRSLALVDFALRRRFHAIEMPPSRSVLESYLQETEDPHTALSMFDLVAARVQDRGVAPGHSYWMKEDVTPAGLEQMWRYELRPYLAEYWFENYAALTSLDDEVSALLSEEA